jgi:hypothetical protein
MGFGFQPETMAARTTRCRKAHEVRSARRGAGAVENKKQSLKLRKRMGLSAGRTLRLSAGETELASLLPDRWAACHPEHVLQHRLDEARRKAIRERRRARKKA